MPYDTKQVEDALRAHGVKPECPSCSSKGGWGQQPVLLLEDNPAHRVGSKGYSMIAVACTSCGFTRLYQANILGLSQPSNDP